MWLPIESQIWLQYFYLVKGSKGRSKRTQVTFFFSISVLLFALIGRFKVGGSQISSQKPTDQPTFPNEARRHKWKGGGGLLTWET